MNGGMELVAGFVGMNSGWVWWFSFSGGDFCFHSADFLFYDGDFRFDGGDFLVVAGSVGGRKWWSVVADGGIRMKMVIKYLNFKN